MEMEKPDTPPQGPVDGALAEGLAELSAVMLSTPDIEGAIREAAVAVAGMLPGNPVAGVTIRRGGDVTTVAATDTYTTVVDEIQYGTGLGPCLEAMETGIPVHVPDVTMEHRWGDYATRVMAHGVGSVYSHPFHGGGSVVGALNLYSPRARGFDQQSQRMIALTSEHIGTLLDAVIRSAQQAQLTGQLRQALSSRSTIDQALGVIMAQQRCDRAAAFAVLRSASQHRNMRLAELAGQILSAVGGTAPEARESARALRRSGPGAGDGGPD